MSMHDPAFPSAVSAPAHPGLSKLEYAMIHLMPHYLALHPYNHHQAIGEASMAAQALIRTAES